MKKLVLVAVLAFSSVGFSKGTDAKSSNDVLMHALSGTPIAPTTPVAKSTPVQPTTDSNEFRPTVPVCLPGQGTLTWIPTSPTQPTK